MIGTKGRMQTHMNDRGSLSVIDEIPFHTNRVFFISDVPNGISRGNHASENSSFLYLMLTGECQVLLYNGFEREEHRLVQGDILHIPRLVWMEFADFQKNSQLCVLSDTTYESAGYIADFDEFLQIARI